MMRLPDGLRRAASEQHGLLTLRQLEGAGWGRGSVEYQTKAGVLDRRRSGVFAVRGAPETWRQRVAEALLLAPDEAFASHRTAARLLGLGRVANPIDITVTDRRDYDIAGVFVHRMTWYNLGDLTRVEFIRCSDVALTLLHLGAVLDQRALNRTVGDALANRKVTLEEIESLLARYGRRGRSGSGALRRAIAARGGFETGSGESGLEERFLRLCVAAGLPVPAVGFEIKVGGRTRFLDFAYEAERIAIEIDGRSSRLLPKRFEDDRSRQNLIVLDGWTILRFTPLRIRTDARGVTAEIRAALALARSRPPSPSPSRSVKGNTAPC